MTTITFDENLNDWDADYYFMANLPYGNVTMGSVGIAETEPDYARTLLGFQRVTERVGRFRQRLRAQPRDLRPPQWVFDDDFDIHRHVPHVELPPGSTEDDLFRLADTILSAPFEPDRPPWSFTFVTGLAGRRSASILKLHHCLSDGTALTALFGSLSANRDRNDEPLFTVETRSASSDRRRSLLDATRHQLTPAIRQGWASTRGLADPIQRRALWTALRETVLSPRDQGRPGRARRSVTFAVPLALWKEAAQARSGGVNELYLALAARIALDTAARGTPPTVTVAMPVNLREGERQAGGNTIGVGRLGFPADVDPLADLADLRVRTAAARDAVRGGKPTLVDSATRLLPGPARATVAYRRSRWPDASATNLVSPTPFEIGDVQMSHAWLVAPAIGSPLSLALFTYLDHVHVSVNADLGLVGEPGVVHQAVTKALAALDLDVPVFGGPTDAV